MQKSAEYRGKQQAGGDPDCVRFVQCKNIGGTH